MEIVSKKQKIMFSENYYMEPYNFYMTVIYKQLLEKFHFQFLYVFNISCTCNKEASSCR